MRIVHAQEPYEAEGKKSIFLAGPIPRKETHETKERPKRKLQPNPTMERWKWVNEESSKWDGGASDWRHEAVELLKEREFDGLVFWPVFKGESEQHSAHKQTEWEWKALRDATVILFWIPRCLKHLPGFTTNIEWGMYHKTGKVVLGYPPGTPKVGYITHCAHSQGVPVSFELSYTMTDALALIDSKERSRKESFDSVLLRITEKDPVLRGQRERLTEAMTSEEILLKIQDLKEKADKEKKERDAGKPGIKHVLAYECYLSELMERIIFE